MHLGTLGHFATLKIAIMKVLSDQALRRKKQTAGHLWGPRRSAYELMKTLKDTNKDIDKSPAPYKLLCEA